MITFKLVIIRIDYESINKLGDDYGNNNWVIDFGCDRCTAKA